jgi:hypothetical protein
MKLGLDKVIDSLRKMGDKRPKKLKQLQRHLASLLGNNVAEGAVDSLVANLLAADAVRLSGDTIVYTRAATSPAA